MARRILNDFKNGSITYLFLVAIDLMVELFQINTSGTVVTLFGVKIISEFTPHALTTTFLIHPRMIVSYMVTIAIFLLGSYFLRKRNLRENPV